MALLDREDLQSLIDLSPAPCVSIYLPTYRAGVETTQNPIRMKNLLREADEKLQAVGADKETIDRVLAPARRLVDDYDFWQHQSDGLALLLGEDTERQYRLPISFEELVVVGDRFHLAPLLPALTGDGQFFVLALSQNRVRLLAASRHDVRELDLHDIPESLMDALGYDWEERSIQFHVGTGRPGPVATKAAAQSPGGPIHGGRKQGAMFHGHGVGTDDNKDEVIKFLKLVDNGINRLLKNRPDPLVLAAVDWVIGHYRELSKHPRLVAEGIEGNPDELSPEELQQRALPLVEPHLRQDQEQATRHFDELGVAGRTSTELEEVLAAAQQGRVATLFLPRGQHRWGRYHLETRKVDEHEAVRPGDEDLLDRAALECLVRGGEVFAVPAEEIPGDGDLAAGLSVLRSGREGRDQPVCGARRRSTRARQARPRWPMRSLTAGGSSP